ncbi:MAG: hypothetical protein ACXVOH_07130 [Bacteroidia bacterium]
MNNSFFKPRPGSIPVKERRKSIFFTGLTCCLLYIVFLLSMQQLNLLHVTELRAVNYLILFVACIMQIRHWMKKYATYVPFLQVLSSSLFTGIWSFALYCIFLSIYTRYNTYLGGLFVEHSRGFTGDFPSVIVLFEGAGVSIIIAFINMQYFRRYEEGEVSPPKRSEHKKIL